MGQFLKYGGCGDGIARGAADYVAQAEMLNAQIRAWQVQLVGDQFYLQQAQAAVTTTLTSASADDPAVIAARGNVDQLSSQVSGLSAKIAAAQDELAQLKSLTDASRERWQNAGDRAMNNISSVISNDKAADGFWVGLADVLSQVAAVVSIAALLLAFVPGLGALLGVLALAMAAIALVINTVNAVSGKTTAGRAWSSALDVALFGVGRVASAGVKAVGAGSKLLNSAKPAAGALSAAGMRAGASFAGKSARPLYGASQGIANAVRGGVNRVLSGVRQVFDTAYVSAYREAVQGVKDLGKTVVAGSKSVTQTLTQSGVSTLNKAESLMQSAKTAYSNNGGVLGETVKDYKAYGNVLSNIATHSKGIFNPMNTMSDKIAFVTSIAPSAGYGLVDLTLIAKDAKTALAGE